MALVLADRVRETTTTTGTGTVTLAGAYTGFQTFSAGVGNTNSTYYTIANVSTGEYEVGIGTYTTSGNTLSRTTVLASSNGGALVNFSAGTKDAFVTQPAERALYIASAGTGLESKVTAFTNGGIVYASSTSALATGSALTFNGSQLGVGGNPASTGIDTGATQAFIVAPNTNTGAALTLVTDSVGRGFLVTNQAKTNIGSINVGSTISFGSNTNTDVVFAHNSTEGFRLTSTSLYTASTINVGIGTSSPSTKLDVVGVVKATGAGPSLISTEGSGQLYAAVQLQATSSGGKNWSLVSNATSSPLGAAGSLSFRDSSVGTTHMTLDASGNLLVGATSTRGGAKLDIRSDTSIAIGSNATYFGTIGYSAGAGLLSIAAESGGGINFLSGATERARIDSSGNLLVGTTTSPGYSGYNTLVLNSATNGGLLDIQVAGTRVGSFQAGSATELRMYAGSGVTSTFYAGGSERARIDSSGNLGIGTSSPAYKLDVTGAINATNTSNTTVATGGFDASTSWSLKVANASTTAGTGAGIFFLGGTNSESWIGNLYESSGVGALSFQTRVSGTRAERMRIDSSGNLLVGTTGANSSRLNAIKGDATGPVIRAESSSGSFTGSLFEGYGGRTTTNGSYNLISVLNGDASGVFKVLDSGNAQNTNNSYGAISDIKLKENVIDATPKLEKLNQVRVVNYNLIGSEQKQIGVIAQELEQIFPGMVEETADKDMEGNDLGTTTKAVKYSIFVPMLIKAIQEQQALIVSMRDELDALKTKVGA